MIAIVPYYMPAPNERAVFATICGTVLYLFNNFLYNTYVP